MGRIWGGGSRAGRVSIALFDAVRVAYIPHAIRRECGSLFTARIFRKKQIKFTSAGLGVWGFRWKSPGYIIREIKGLPVYLDLAGGLWAVLVVHRNM